MDNIINSDYTINDFIKYLQSLNETYRSKPIVIRAKNGILFQPVVKQLLDDDKNFMQGWEHIQAAIITY